jgi:hypothetical protein
MVNIQRLWLIVISSFIAGAGRFALRKEKGQPQLTLSPFALNDRPAVKIGTEAIGTILPLDTLTLDRQKATWNCVDGSLLPRIR